MKSILLVGINAKFSHTSLGVYCVGAYLREKGIPHQVAEYTINDPYERIFYDIVSKKPDYIGFSTYLWNITLIRRLIGDLKLALPDVKIFLGGPEAGYCANPREEYPLVDAVIPGEGEAAVYRYLTGEEAQDSFPCLPFPYEGSVPRGKTIYYEASRGCPYRCSYCISSLEKSLRFKDLDKVREELSFFIRQKVKRVKFIDRTFNVHPHAYDIWQFIIVEGGDTSFHFEIKPELFSEKDLALLAKAPVGKIQLEAGLQSLNPHTLSAIHRTNDTDQAFANLKAILSMGNIHLHLDLIAGLPYEDKKSFIRGFDCVYAIRPHMLQLGFLKILNGTEMQDKAEEYGIVYSPHPPYQVISTKWISVEDMMELKIAEEGLNILSNKGFFEKSLSVLWEKNTVSYYETFLSFGKELKTMPPLSHPDLFRLVWRWYQTREFRNSKQFLEALHMDFKSKNPNKPMF